MKLSVGFTVNKKNGQINMSLPKKKISKKMLKEMFISKNKKLNIDIKGVA